MCLYYGGINMKSNQDTGFGSLNDLYHVKYSRLQIYAPEISKTSRTSYVLTNHQWSKALSFTISISANVEFAYVTTKSKQLYDVKASWIWPKIKRQAEISNRIHFNLHVCDWIYAVKIFPHQVSYKTFKSQVEHRCHYIKFLFLECYDLYCLSCLSTILAASFLHIWSYHPFEEEYILWRQSIYHDGKRTTFRLREQSWKESKARRCLIQMAGDIRGICY